MQKQKFNIQELSLEQLFDGRKKAFSNAQDLIADARILFKNKKWARCAFLSYIAIEEFGKYEMIVSAIVKVVLGKMDWKRFWVRFRSHHEKTKNIIIFDVPLAPTVEHDAFVKDISENASKMGNRKMDSIYLDFRENKFCLPKDSFEKSDAEISLCHALTVSNRFGPTERILFSKMTPDKKRLKKSIETTCEKSSRDCGIDLQKILEMTSS